MRQRRPRLLSDPPRKPAREHIVPMINVVFLLLIFFLLTAQIAPPDPFEITLPKGQGSPEEAPPALYLSSEGEIAFAESRGDAAIQAALATDGPLTLRADASAQASTLAQILQRLGTRNVILVTEGG